jgi:peptide/nickel transport system permease protein
MTSVARPSRHDARTGEAVGDLSAFRQPRSRSTWRRFRRDQAFVLGATVLLFVILVSVSAPRLSLSNPNAVDAPHRLMPPLSSGHPMGTDDLGRDLLSRLVWGARLSLVAGFTATALAMAIGVPFGLLAGYYGGWIDETMMRFTDALMAFPYILLPIAIAAALGPGLFNAMVAIAVTTFPLFSRLIRGAVLSVREYEYIEAARALGANNRRVLLRHVFPIVIPSIIIAGTLQVGDMIIATSSLSFLGLGTQPPTADWGNMLAGGRAFVTVAPHIATLPGLAIVLVVLASNLMGDGLRDALDPRL